MRRTDLEETLLAIDDLEASAPYAPKWAMEEPIKIVFLAYLCVVLEV